jgi:Tol biopolymer transport system component
MVITSYLRASAIVAGALAALMVLVALGDNPAEAKKRHSGGLIVFNTNRNIDGLNPTNDMEIFSIKPDGTGLRQLTFNEVLDDGAVISSDGTKMAYSSREDVVTSFGQHLNPTGARQIWVMDLTAEEPFFARTQLTFGSTDSWTPDWSPDGTKIAFTRGSGFASEIYVMNADGDSQQPLTSNSVPDFRPAYSPNGLKIAFTSLDPNPAPDGGDFEIFDMLASNGSSRQQLTVNRTQDYRPAYSPDGKKIVYDSAGVGSLNPEGDFEVMKMNADGSGTPTNLTNNSTDDLRASFSPSGKIVYESLTSNSTNTPNSSPSSNPGDLFTMKSDGSGERNLTQTNDNLSINQLADWGRTPKAR